MKSKLKTTIAKTTIIAVFCLAVTFCFCQKQITIISNSKSSYHIVLAPGANAVDSEAADVLQKYLSDISGCTLPITREKINTSAKQLIIGNTSLLSAWDKSGLQNDGVLIKSMQSSVLFSGGIRKGVLYSVYTFLDSVLHCTMYSHVDFITPRSATIQVPANLKIKQIPSFDYRMGGFYTVTKQYCDFNKQNYLFEDWGLWVHSFNILVPPQEYFTSHPEYFALHNGKRTPDQLCLTNADVLRITVKNLAAKIKDKPDARFWSVSQNDNQSYCECENCKRVDSQQQSHQGSVLQFVNKVAAYFPDKTITTLAYQYSQKPPKSIVPQKNVLVMLCSLNEQRSKPISTNGTKEFKDDFVNWTKKTNNLMVWDYVVQFSNSMAPFPNFSTLQPNIKYFASRHVPYLFEEGFIDQPSSFSELRTYLISKLMWNANTDVKAETNKFIQAFYGGAAAPYIEQYMQLLYNNSLRSNANLHIFGKPADQSTTFLTPADLAAYKIIFQKLLTIIPVSDSHYSRVIKEYLSVLYSEIDIAQSALSQRKNNNAAEKEKLRQLLKEFSEKARSVPIQYLNEGQETIEQYQNKLKSIIEL